MVAGFLLILGIFFLLQDLGMWAFWNIQWYTVLFLLVGVSIFCSGACPSCQSCCSSEGKTGKKK